MDMESFNCQMAIFMKVFLKMIKKKVKVSINGQMVLNTKANLIKVKSKAQGFTQMQRQARYSRDQTGGRI
jgi:hypothetical protein